MKNICNKLRWLFLFSFGFSNIENPLKRIVTLTSRQAIEISPHNKKLLDQQIKNQEESRKESSETNFNKILFSSAPGEVEETKTKTSTETSKPTKIKKSKRNKKDKCNIFKSR